MIAWSIDAAKRSSLFDRVLVSTDDANIAEVAIKWGAEVPFLRPTELADDFAGTTEVVAHATKWALGQGWQVTTVCCIYATAPLMQVDDLSRGLSALRSGSWKYAFSATDFATSVFRAMTLTEEGGVRMIFPDYFRTRSQDLPISLHDAAQFYWGTADAWLEQEQIFSERSIPVLIPSARVQDIDTPSDWAMAESLFNLTMKNSS